MGQQKVIIKAFGESPANLAAKLSAVETDGVKIRFSEEYLDDRVEIVCENGDDVAFYSAIETVKDAVSDIYAEEDVSLEAALVDALRKAGKKVSVAESVTGGLIASKIVSVAGASDVFYEGLVTYDCNAKVQRLHVPSSLIEERGVVSEEVCRAMAFGLLSSKNADYAVATTGCAGPLSDRFGTPLGRVFIGCADACKKIVVKRFDFRLENASADMRNYVRGCAANAAIYTLINKIKREE